MHQTLTVDQLFEQIKQLSPTEQFRLVQTILTMLFQQTVSSTETTIVSQPHQNHLPLQATLEEAIRLYQTEQCSLAKAADLADLTRWELQEILYERGTPVEIYLPDSVDEMDARLEEMAQDGLLC